MENNNAYEKKTFKTFIILMITCLLSPFVFNSSLSSFLREEVIFKLIFIYITGVIILISYIVYKKERVYWISSYTYSDALKMTSQERKRIGFKLFKVVGTYFGILVVYFFVGIFLHFSLIVDTIVFSLLAIITCIKA